MSTAENDDFIAKEGHSYRPDDGSDFSAPLNAAKSGRLVFASSGQGLELLADPSLPYLYRASFRHHVPRVSVQGNIVTLDYGRHPLLRSSLNLRRPRADISLNGAIPWEIEFRKEVSHLNAELSRLQLRSLDILGGASQIRLRLSQPSGTAFIYISGCVSQAAIRVPFLSGIRVRISGGSTNLTFGDQHFRAIGGETSLQSPDFESTAGRYDICIAGGTSNLAIERKG